jgi:hypothetical protein
MPGSGKGKPATWEEARAGFKPAELVRGKRSLTVEYRWDGDRWTATSSDLDGFEVSALSLPQLKTAARAVLDDWLDPAVQVREVVIGDAGPSLARTSGRWAKNRGRWTPVKTAAAVLRGKRQGKARHSISTEG